LVSSVLTAGPQRLAVGILLKQGVRRVGNLPKEQLEQLLLHATQVQALLAAAHKPHL
jgi:hypothetical protein